MVHSAERTKSGKLLNVPTARDNIARLELLYEVNKKAESNTTRLQDMLEQVILMSRRVLNAESALVLLFNDYGQELYFEAVTGPVGKALRQEKITGQYGIAGQVVRTNQPLIVNDVSRNANFHQLIDDATGFSTKSLVCAPLSVKRKVIGVIEVINKQDGGIFDEEDIKSVVSIATTAAMAIENTQIQQSLLEAYKSTVTALASTVDAKDRFTQGHSERVMEYSLKAGAALSISDEEAQVLQYAGALHDVGKIIIDSNILSKPGPLTSGEWDIMHTHPSVGAKLLKEIPYLERAAELVLRHHERYDGTGYPDRLRGEAIPLGARIIAAAEAFDTMTTDRPYRQALSIDKAVKELNKCAGSQFCPVAVKGLLAGLHLDESKK
ncbi:MAG: HD domain-containing protein [Dehalococcoidales bacterium]|nr:HD domain-containing protein [Dehalococcoidales bacterium]